MRVMNTAESKTTSTSAANADKPVRQLVVATRNKGKVKEIQALLRGFDVEVLTLADMPEVPEVVEDGDTFTANALKKATEVADCTGMVALADDSGLEVDALDGRPGVYSARFSGPGATDRRNLEMLLDMMRDVPQEKRTARFRCAIAIARPDGEARTAEGSCEGRIGYAPRGDNGFGYDPVFEVPEYGWATFAELPSDVKNTMSHRARALRASLGSLRELLGL
jgi:XTP/dITP diphosphohydrolase